MSLAPADVRTCVSIQALLGHLAVETAKWVPDKDPFSPAVAAQIHTTAASLARSVPQAQTSLVRLAVNANAQAFGGVAHAMKAKDRKAFDKALVNTKAAFRGLKQVCNLDK